MAYRPAHFSTTEPFLLVFTAIYLIIPILFAAKQPPDLKGFVDATLVFGAPLAAFGLQSRLVGDMPHGLAISAAALAAVYAMLGTAVFRRGGEELRVLAESYTGLAVVFSR